MHMKRRQTNRLLKYYNMKFTPEQEREFIEGAEHARKAGITFSKAVKGITEAFERMRINSLPKPKSKYHL